MNILEELFEYARRNGIRRAEIGRHIWGKKNVARIYMVKNPTIKTLNTIKKAIDELILQKK